MTTRVKALTRSAILAALATVLVCISATFPSGRLALIAIAGLTGALAVIHCGGWWACGVFIASALLSQLLASDKGNAVLYTVFLGYYPALKSLIERLHSLTLCWITKLCIFNAVFALLWFLAKTILLDGTDVQLPLWLLWLGVNVVFVLYDIGLSRLIYVYIRNFAGKMK